MIDREGLVFNVNDGTDPAITLVKDLINRQEISGPVKIERGIMRNIPWQR